MLWVLVFLFSIVSIVFFVIMLRQLNPKNVYIPPTTSTFIPEEDKRFNYAEGDFLCVQEGKAFGIIKVLKIERIDLHEGRILTVGGTQFKAPGFDYFLCIHIGAIPKTFNSIEEARTAVTAGTLSAQLKHVPMRPSGLTSSIIALLGKASVSQEDLAAYNQWRYDFDVGQGSIQ